MNCLACKNKISRGEVLVCINCKGCYHYKCLTMSLNTYTAVKNNWICPSCSMVTKRAKGDETPTRRQFEQSPVVDADMSCDELIYGDGGATESAGDTARSSGTDAEPNLSDILNELRALRGDFTGMRSDIQGVTRSILEINKRFGEMESRISDIEDRLTATEKSTTLIPRLQQDLDSAKNKVVTLEREIQQRDQLARQNNIEISGIPLTAGENLLTVLRTISDKVGFSLDERDIDGLLRVRRFEMANVSKDSHNPRPRPPAIIVKFTRRLCKDKFLAAVRSRRGLTTADINLSGPSQNVYVSDHLTPQNKILLKQARQLKVDLGYTYLWVRDCKIFMRKNDKSGAIMVKSESDLAKLK